MSASLLVLGIALGGIGLILFLILAIIALVNNNKKNTIVFSSMFAVSVIIVVICLSSVFNKVGEKITSEIKRSYIEETKRQEEETQARETERAAYKDWLKELAPAEYKDSLAGFYDTFDMDNNAYCIPMVYPYRLEMNEAEESHAWLAAANGKKIHELEGLVAFTDVSFDGNMMLAKRDITFYEGRLPVGLPEISYILYDFKTGKSRMFLNQRQLIEEAEKAGFTGNTELEAVSDLYSKL